MDKSAKENQMGDDQDLASTQLVKMMLVILALVVLLLIIIQGTIL